MSTLPLLPDTPLAIAYCKSKAISRAEFLGEVLALAARLPNTNHIFNLCQDRYWFSVTLFAAISRGILSVLPNSTAPEHIASLWAELPDMVCLGDRPVSPFPYMPYLQVSAAASSATGTEQVMPRIPFDQRVACVYTSGSTGKPQPHIKTFGRLQQCAAAAAVRVWAAAKGSCAVLGTVPSHHMYGLESTILLPIFGGGQLSVRQPFFPADIASALAELPEPRLLVTTPFHLRKLMDANIKIPGVAAVLCATAPLSLELAKEVENRLGAPIMEIYGSTETGQLATRCPTLQTEWDTFADIVLTKNQDTTTATGGHLEGAQVMNDVVELVSPSRFRLLGRNADMINIVGKRSSLAFLNHVLTNLPGIQDGVFCLPETDSNNEVSRLAAFVVAPQLSSNEITAALLPQLPAVFLPRPIIFIDALPRDGNGKIPAAILSALIARHLSPRT